MENEKQEVYKLLLQRQANAPNETVKNLLKNFETLSQEDLRDIYRILHKPNQVSHQLVITIKVE